MTAGRDQPYLVVDATVSLKWTLDDEEAVEQAVALRDAALWGRFRMVAPSLWLYEVTNGLVMAVRRHRTHASVAEEALGHLLALGLRLADPEPRDVYDQAIRYGVGAYDAAYLALARALGAQLWTGDRRFYNTVRQAVDFVHWIGDYEQDR